MEWDERGEGWCSTADNFSLPELVCLSEVAMSGGIVMGRYARGLHCFHCMLYKITLTLTVEYCRMMRVIFLFFLLAIEVAFLGTG